MENTSGPVLCPYREISTEGPWCAWGPMSLAQAHRLQKTNNSPVWGRTWVLGLEDRGLSVSGDQLPPQVTGCREAAPHEPSAEHTAGRLLLAPGFPWGFQYACQGALLSVAQLQPRRRLVLPPWPQVEPSRPVPGVPVAIMAAELGPGAVISHPDPAFSCPHFLRLRGPARPHSRQLMFQCSSFLSTACGRVWPPTGRPGSESWLFTMTVLDESHACPRLNSCWERRSLDDVSGNTADAQPGPSLLPGQQGTTESARKCSCLPGHRCLETEGASLDSQPVLGPRPIWPGHRLSSRLPCLPPAIARVLQGHEMLPGKSNPNGRDVRGLSELHVLGS